MKARQTFHCYDGKMFNPTETVAKIIDKAHPRTFNATWLAIGSLLGLGFFLLS
jgi:hypothetical protein